MRHGTSGLWIWLIVLFVALLLLIPAIFRERPIHPVIVRQRAQLHSIDTATELFNNEFDSYLPSDANDLAGKPSCGAMRLAEALLGQDLLGFHSKSLFRRDGLDPNTLAPLYPPNPSPDNLRLRKGPYLNPENANPFRLADIFGKGKTGPLPEDAYVLCDTYIHKRPSGKKTGMPILYYRASRLGRGHRAGDPNNIYHCEDNQALIALGVPGDPNKTHPLLDPNRFYLNTQNHQNTSQAEPHRRDSYILISAGWDGLYGTADDICNFQWRYRER